MADRGPDWAALGRVFAALSGGPAEPAPGAEEADAPARELAEERAAIMEYDAGVSRERAEALAYRAHGLPPPRG